MAIEIPALAEGLASAQVQVLEQVRELAPVPELALAGAGLVLVLKLVLVQVLEPVQVPLVRRRK